MNEILFLRFFTALATTNADDPDIHAANDYAISLVKSNRAALTRAEAAEAERDEYKLQRDKWIADEPATEAEAARLRDECSRAEMAAIYFEARVAELEAQLAAQGWRPGSETPPPDWYQTAETIDGVFSHAYFDGAVWQGYPDNYPPMWYRPIPPLPAPAPQEPTL